MWEYTLTTRLIEAEPAFAQLEEPWSRLSTAARTRPFQDFGWISAWAETIGRTEGRELRIATLWDGSHLVGLLPMVRRRYLGVRMLEWAGARAAEYCDAIIHPNVDTRHNGVAAIDLLRGADSFKLQYHPQPEPLQTFVIPRGLIGNICLLAYRRHVVGQRPSRSARGLRD